MFLTILRSLISYFFIGITLLIFAPPISLFLIMPQRWRFNSKLFYMLIYAFYKVGLFFTFVPIKIKGEKNIPTKPAIIAANHQSAIDIPLVAAAIGIFPHIWLAKAELFKTRFLRLIIPFIAIPIDTSSLQKAMRSLLKVVQTVQKYDAHAMIFPEGGRYHNNDIHKFYAGFVLLAKKQAALLSQSEFLMHPRFIQLALFWHTGIL